MFDVWQGVQTEALAEEIAPQTFAQMWLLNAVDAVRGAWTLLWEAEFCSA